jgi:hypothetical protein
LTEADTNTDVERKTRHAEDIAGVESIEIKDLDATSAGESY